jgi:hypothetical protein
MRNRIFEKVPANSWLIATIGRVSLLGSIPDTRGTHASSTIERQTDREPLVEYSRRMASPELVS